jgi:hypothetical protein
VIPDRTGEVWWLHDSLHVIVGPPKWLVHRDVSRHPCLDLETGRVAWAHEAASSRWVSGANGRTRLT